MKTKIITALSLCLALNIASADPTAFINARVVTVTQGVIEDGTLIIDGSRIVAMGHGIPVPEDARIIDCEGMSIYPGFIDSGTQLGLLEIGSLAETRDSREIGDYSPQMKALTAVNPSSVAIPVTRVSGVTTALTEPSGGLLPGQAALINLHGYTPGQMYAGFEAVYLNFPSTGRRGRFDQRSEKEIEKASKEALERLNDTFEKARQYHRIDSTYRANPSRNKPEYVPAIEALLPVLRGQQAIIIEVNTAKDILSAIEWVKAQNLGRAIFTGLAEGWRVADQIAEAEIPCLVGPVLSIPTRDSDRFDKAYANAGLMESAGVKVALRSGDTANSRNLPYNAGFAAAYGMAEALRAVTIVPAEIFGVADAIGSLEVGKRATLFIADGDPFETSTNIHHVYIDGYEIPMASRHTELYDEFLARNPGLDKL